jgi:hypothetical protein
VIDKIYIPTIHRADNQFTFDDLPKELQDKVVMVVDPAERSMYNYSCGYLELPKEIIGQWTQLAQTRKFIHQHAGNIKYAMIDDDLLVYKRNQKYFTDNSDMETSKRKATSEEILRLFETASQWLDEDDIGIVGLSDGMVPPADTEYVDTKGVFGYLFFDGKKISKIVNDMDTSIRVAEDLLFLFECLSNGINTRMSNEFLYVNKSATDELKNKRPIWEGLFETMPKDYFQTKEHYEALQYILKKYPLGITIFEENGIMKNVKHYRRIYKTGNQPSLESFFND